ncbi:hypothetical protein GCM10011519_21580 [Marmoricola endophyticus]|uniref:Protein kinase domain-containing protein n=1 Tax=Marmoricola endophyticus TaxID=2040280 RepID=A0A917BJW7_9ACTN|nr:protein kinase family protein [Marmoricola endophyticus]GGF47215.1 hypothetical protein GCM10011519_21580 [Marmoricola endophyticus]
MSTASSAGVVLGGRYRLEDLLDDVDGARAWRATDTVLVRDVRVWALPEEDPRVEAVLEAARVSARVTDAHLLRVLDADVRDGLAWVVSEWGEGRTLADMVGRGVLPPDRSAWLTREVATAIASAAGHGLAHGRLAPENVMVTTSGTVRLVGFAIDAAVQETLRRSGDYPEVTDAEADVLDLAGLLYAGLVGRWPGASGSRVDAAPRDGHGPLRPRQVRAGVPRPLDALCDRVLSRRRGDLDAQRMAAVLTEYLGELAAADPSLLPATTPGVPVLEDGGPSDSGDPAAPVTEDREPAVVPDDVPVPPVSSPVGERPEPRPSSATPAAASGTTTADEGSELPGNHRAAEATADDVEDGADRAAEVADDDPDRTLVGKHRPTGPDDDPDWHKPRPGPRPPAPDLEAPPERPLFAPDDGPRRTRPAAVRSSATESWGATDWSRSHPVREWEAGDRRDEEPRWPFGGDHVDALPDLPPDAEPQSHWLRLPLILGLVAVLAIVVAFLLAFHGGGS